MQTSIAKKLFAVGSVAAMALALVPAFASAALDTPGHNCLSNGTVFFLNAQGQKQPYTSAGAFLSYGTNSWSNVVNCSAEDLALPTGSFVTPADGKFYIDSIDHRTIYLISNGQRIGVASAAAFLGLGYSFGNATVADTSFMTTLSPITSSAIAHPQGTLIKLPNGEIDLMGPNGRMGIPSLSVFNSWGYSFKDVVLANSYDQALSLSGVMPAMVPGYLNPLSVPGNVVITPASGIAVSLAVNTPPSGTIVAGQSTADLAHFNFSGSGTVTQLTLNRIGVSANTTLNNVYLYNGNLRITDASAVNSNGQIVFNNPSGLFTSPAVISVRADIASSTNGQTTGVSVASAMSGTNSISGNPAGNLMTIAAPGTLSTAAFGSVTPSLTTNVNAGSLNYSVWSAPLTITNRSAVLKGASFKVIGSAATDALQNYILYVDGQQAATASGLTAVNGSNYAVFNPSSPFTVTTGSHTLEVRADVIKGSARNVTISLANVADIMLADNQLGVNITPTGVPASSAEIDINSGTVAFQLDPTFNATTTIPGGAVNVPIAKFNLTGYGEDVQINTLVATVTLGGAASGNGINNVALYANGLQVGSTQQILAGGSTATFNLGSSLIVPAGQTTNLVVRADTINAANATISSGTIAVSIVNSGANVSNSQGRSSQNVVTVPSGTITAPTLTVGSGGATVASNAGYQNQTISPNTTAAKIGSFVIQAGNNEDIRITNLSVGLTTDGSTALTTLTTPPLSDVSNLRISVNGGTPAAPIAPQATNNFSQNFNVPINGTATVDVWADLGSTDSSSSHIVATLLPTGTGVVSNNNVSFSRATGQTITTQSGSLSAPTFTTSSSSASQFVASAGGATAATHNSYNFTASNGSVNVSELKFVVVGTAGSVASVGVGNVSAPVVTPATTSLTVSSTLTTGSEILTVTSTGNLSVGSIIQIGSEDMLVTAVPSATTVTVTHAVLSTTGVTHTAPATVTIFGTAYLTGLALNVPNGAGGIYIDAQPTYTSIGANGLASASTAQLALTYEKFTAGSTTTAQSVTPVLANNMTLVGSAPTLAVTTTNNSGLIVGENHLMDLTVAANAKGNIQVNTIVFTVSPTSSITGESAPRLAIGSTTITGSSCSGTTTVTCTLPPGYVINAGTSQTFSLYETLASSGGLGAAGTSSVTTSLAAASNFSWTDTAGGGSAVTTANTTFLNNYPTQTWSLHN